MSEILDTWTEIRTSDSGISATLYSEWEGGEVIVEDEMWLTQDELSDSREITSLNLSQESREAIHSRSDDSDDTQKNGVELIQETMYAIEEGDWVFDKSPPSWSEDAPNLQVIEVTDMRADEYVIEEAKLFKPVETVADANPEYPSDDRVVLCRFGDQMDSDEPYAYPESRLTLDKDKAMNSN